MPAPIQLRISDLPQSSFSALAASSSEGPTFSERLKTVQSQSDQSNSAEKPADSSAPAAHAKPKSKHNSTHKAKKDATDTQLNDAETPDDSQATLENPQAAAETDAEQTAKADAQADDGCKKSQPSDADLAALVAQNAAQAVTPSAAQIAARVASTGKKAVPQTGDAGEQAAATPTRVLKAGKEQPKNIEKTDDSADADSAGKQASHTSQQKPILHQADADQTQLAAPLAAGKPTKAQQDKAAAIKHEQQQPSATTAQATAIATAPAATPVASDGSANVSTLESAAHDHDDSAPAKNAQTPTITTAHTMQQQSTQSADSAAEAQEPQALDREQTFDQILLGLRGKMDARNGKAEIQLNPPNLGTVHVSINLDKGNLTAQFQSESGAVRDLLKDHMEKLKTVLEASGVSVDKLSVESPTDPTAQTKSTNSQNTGTANHDGRSAGEYTQDNRRKRSDDSNAFAKQWQSFSKDQSPIDLVA